MNIENDIKEEVYHNTLSEINRQRNELFASCVRATIIIIHPKLHEYLIWREMRNDPCVSVGSTVKRIMGIRVVRSYDLREDEIIVK